MSPKKKPLVSQKEWRLFALISLILCVIVGGVTALVVITNVPEEPKNALPKQSPFKSNVADTIPKKVVITDFILPAPGGEWLSRSWLYSRSPLGKWTDQDIAPYWTEPSQLQIMRLPQDNDRLINDIFKDVK